MNLIDLAETGLVPDALIRLGIRRLLANRLKSFGADGCGGRDTIAGFADSLRGSPLAVETDAANQQHYEVTSEFFEHVLPHSGERKTGMAEHRLIKEKYDLFRIDIF